jgi:hypothetical protein
MMLVIKIVNSRTVEKIAKSNLFSDCVVTLANKDAFTELAD